MLLRDEFVKSGNFLFRWRGYLPLFFLAAVVGKIYFDHLFDRSSSYDFWWPIYCLFIGMIGIVIRVIAVAFVPYGNSGRGTDTPYADSLNQTGMYSIMRNPVYFGNFFTFLAPVVFARSWWLVAIYIPVFALYHERIIFAEENFLLGKFGKQYLDWADRTPAFFPDFSKWENPHRRFCWKTAYRRESISFFTLVSTIWFLMIVCDYLTQQKFVFDAGWTNLFIASAVFYLSNCVLVRYTKTLEV